MDSDNIKTYTEIISELIDKIDIYLDNMYVDPLKYNNVGNGDLEIELEYLKNMDL